MKIQLLLLILTLIRWPLFGQSQLHIDLMLDDVVTVDSSQNIANNTSAIQIIDLGKSQLPYLMDHFGDSTITQVYSSCVSRNLTRGEIAIIIADRIEFMPYFQLTGLQNCTLSYCDASPNFIEYYLNRIQQQGIADFTTKYSTWLTSKERRKWYVNRRKYFKKSKQGARK